MKIKKHYKFSSCFLAKISMLGSYDFTLVSYILNYWKSSKQSHQAKTDFACIISN